MAKAEKTGLAASPEPAPAKGGVKKYLIFGFIAIVAAGAGFAVPQFLIGSSPKHEPGTPVSETKREGTHPVFVPFGDLVVNLAEERLTRYLRVSITLQVNSQHENVVKQAVEKNKAILKSGLIGYLSNKSLDEVRGAMGVNRSRREIQDQFNSTLFPDGSEIIQDVLFEEFTVQ
jgi:flagellar FliL protein